jgi:hypothetical protein
MVAERDYDAIRYSQVEALVIGLLDILAPAMEALNG